MQQVMPYTHSGTSYPTKSSKKICYATVGSKYQIVIPKQIRQEINLKPGEKLYIDATEDGTIHLIVPPKNWADQNLGALKRYWKGIDMIKEVEKIRNESETKD